MKIKSRLLELDCLRGVAAILVVTFHFTLNQPELKQYFRFGCIGVDLFFIISGFVIFLTIENHQNYKRFLISRFAKLFPTYWFAVSITTFSIIVWSISVKQPIIFPTLSDYFFNLTMIQHYLKVIDIDVVYWTLLVELLFYLFVVVILFLKKIEQIELIGTFALVFCVIFETVIKYYLPIYHEIIKFYFPLINFFSLFLAGIIFYKMKFHGFKRYQCLLLVGCFAVQVLMFRDTNKMIFTMTQGQYAVFIGFFFTLFFLYGFNKLNFIINKSLLFVGRISYSLYLTHNYIAFNLLIPLLTLSKHIKLTYWVADFLIVLPIMLLLAFLLNKYIEIPVTNYIKKQSIPLQ